MANESNCNWWDSSSTTRRTPTFSSSIIDSSGATVSASPDHHSSHMMGLGLSSHQPLHHHWNTNLHPNPPPLMKGDGGFRSILEEGMPEFSSMKRSSPSMFSHSNSSVDSSSHGGGLPSPTFLTPLESSGIFQGHIMASSPNDHNSGYGYHQPTGMIGMPMSSCNSDDIMMGMNWTTSSNKDQFSQLLKSSSMVDIPKPVQVQPQFMNMNSPGSFWNGAAAPVADPRPFFPVAPPQMAMPSFGDKRKNNVMEVRNASGVGRKSTSGSARTSSTATASTTSTGGATAKRPRNEASSTALPPFKVRKEKMGDRITALQQLVSPFGKTDTASVLSEAIEYIKFLHEQVNTLSTPYLKSGVSLQQQQQRSHDKFKDPDEGARKDLRSRGLCLVPISSTFPVAHETTVDFWTPTFGPAGAFR